MSYLDNDQRLNQRLHINDIVIEGLLDTDAEVRIITLVYWHAVWSLEDIHFLEIGTLFHMKKAQIWLKYGAKRTETKSAVMCI